jgi:uncharacterized lipoprotein
MKFGFVALAAASTISLFTACSSSPSSKTGNSSAAMSEEDAKKGKVCTYEIPVGSNLREKRCTTFEQREAQRRQGEQLQATPPPTGAR